MGNFTSTFNIQNFFLSILGPVLASMAVSSPVFFHEYIIFLVLMYIYTYIIIYYKCKKINHKGVALSMIPWFIWAVVLYIIGFLNNPIFIISDTIGHSIIGLIVVGIIFYLPVIKLSNKCF